jgi:GNAT superfamily N-acetyltransferase
VKEFWETEMRIDQQTKLLPELCTPAPVRAYEAIAHLEATYPGFSDWYWGKVVPGMADGTRWLRIVERSGRIDGVAIAKNDNAERKLCTVWVRPELLGAGLGVRLIREGCAWLGTERPLASVPEELMPQYEAILSRLGFSLDQVLDGYYRPGRREFVFNGRLTALH